MVYQALWLEESHVTRNETLLPICGRLAAVALLAAACCPAARAQTAAPAEAVSPAEAAPAAEAGPPAAAAPAVHRLVQALGSGSLATRDAAERALVALGPTALPAITEAGRDTVGEAAFRLRGIRRELEGQAAAMAADGGHVDVTVAGVEPIGGTQAAATGVRVRLRMAWQDGPAPLVVKLPLKSIVAEGVNGEVMPPAQRAAVLEAAVPKNRRWLELPVALAQPALPLESLAILRGTVMVWVTGMEHAFEFAGIERPQDLPWQPRTLRLGEARVILDDVAVRQERLLVTATIAYDSATEALASHRTWLGERQLELVAADGTATRPLVQTVRNRSDQGLTATAEFARPASVAKGGLRVRWKLPIAIHEVPVDFAIHDVLLPPR